MKIDVQALLAALAEAPTGEMLQESPVSEYVLTHIYEPLKRGEGVSYSELDFSQFGGDDIDALGTELENRDMARNRLYYLNQRFCQAEPISASTRNFC